MKVINQYITMLPIDKMVHIMKERFFYIINNS